MKRILIILLTLCAATAYGAVPQLINYQGFLTDTDGAPLDTVVTMTFKLYDAGGTPLWTETQPACTVRAGSFNVLLGSVVAVPDSFQGTSRWLGVTVGGNSEMVPRAHLVSVPYAYRVGTVDGASGGTISGDVNIAGKGNIGSGNVNMGAYAFVAGYNDTASGDYSTVGGGEYNDATGQWSTVGGGYDNNAIGMLATVGGGQSNTASGGFATVGGGWVNEASGYGATVGGGYSNTASSTWYATVGGGYDNNATGFFATVPGGIFNDAAGAYSIACGRRAKASRDGCFRWADATNADFVAPADSANSFAIRATGGVYLYTNSALSAGAQLWAGGSAWSAISDSTKKRNIRLVDTRSILEKVARLPIKQWSYRSQDPSIEHVGPTAQDFWSLFHVGDDSLGISTIDPAGIALAAIQELHRQNQELQKELTALRARMQTLEAAQQQSLNRRNDHE